MLRVSDTLVFDTEITANIAFLVVQNSQLSCFFLGMWAKYCSQCVCLLAYLKTMSMST